MHARTLGKPMSALPENILRIESLPAVSKLQFFLF